MPNRYFANFPEINYNGFNIVDITKSAMLINKYVNIPYVYQQYGLDKDQRADNVASDFYGDVYMTWLIYYANKVIDPYYDWYLNDYDFNQYITLKYGTIDIAQRKIKYFISNWFNDSTELRPVQYNARFGEFKGFNSSYWQPNFDENSGNILFYTRTPSNYIKNNNKLVKLEVDGTIPFNLGDLLTFTSNASFLSVGSGEVVEVISNTSLIIKNVLITNASALNINFVLQKDDETISVVTDYSTTEDLTQNVWTKYDISDEEYVYWVPLTYYDYEKEINENKKTVNLVDGTTAIAIINQLKVDLNG